MLLFVLGVARHSTEHHNGFLNTCALRNKGSQSGEDLNVARRHICDVVMHVSGMHDYRKH